MNTKQQTVELLASLGQTLETLSPETIARLYSKKEQFVKVCGVAAMRLGEPKLVVHKDIRIRFTAGGRDYLACGFLKADEHPVDGQIMLDRTEVEGTKPIDDEDWGHLCKYRTDFPKKDFISYLTTARCRPWGLSYFSYDGLQWSKGSWIWALRRWHSGSLVLRRCL